MYRDITIVSVFLLLYARKISAWTASDLYLINEEYYPQARCLDGSMGGFWYHAPNDTSNSQNFVINLEGGGECVDKASCLDRAKSDLGSSNNWNNTKWGYGPWSSDVKTNPDLWGYTMIHIGYCSGDLFSGTVKDPTDDTWGLYFSGHFILDAVIQHLFTNPDGEARPVSNLIIAGESAGGLGAFINLDYIRDAVLATNPDATVVGFPIGGFYFSNPAYPGSDAVSYVPWDNDAFHDYYNLWNAFVPERCAATKNDPWVCLVANYSFATLEADVFVVEAQTDGVVLPLHTGFPFTPPFDTQPAIDFATQWSDTMKESLKQVQNRASCGVFNVACWIHTNFFTGKDISDVNPKIESTVAITAFGDWMFRHQNINLQDTCGLTCNPTCPSSV